MAKPQPVLSIRIALVAGVVLLASCFGGKPPPVQPAAPGPTQLNATLQVADNVNPDVRGRASPVVVKLYELKAPTAFESADFFSLYERDRETLGGDLVAVEELQLLPGEKRAFTRTLQGGTRYVGVLAAFRAVERAQWRATLAVEANRLNRVLIKLDGTRASIGAAPEASK